MENRALVLFSGGQDSTTCLAWALSRFNYVETIGFDYGQRHRIELECRGRVLSKLREISSEWRARLGEDHLLDLAVLGEISHTALTSEREIELSANGLPNTFVPGRNLLFFTFAAAVAYRRNLPALIGGMCETDYSGYPDCRSDTLESLQKSICLGMDMDFKIVTPLMHIDKSETWRLANAVGGKPLVDLIVEETHTCYLGDRGTRHVWGYGCGSCPACELRENGYADFLAEKA